jgi:ATP-dependent Clp protease protease subunit
LLKGIFMHDDTITGQDHIPYPHVVEQTHNGERTWDIFSRLLHDRIIFLGTFITDELANIIIAQMLYLESNDPEKDIALYINSPGGSVNAGLAIYDTMQYLRCPVVTICFGRADAIAAILLMAGQAERRVALPNNRITMRQPLGGISGQASDIEIHAREILRLSEKLNKIIAKHTGQSFQKVKKDTERDYIMTAPEALKYGIIDEIMERRSPPQTPHLAT